MNKNRNKNQMAMKIAAFLLHEQSQEGASEYRLRLRLRELRTALCTALQMTDLYNRDLDFAIENDLSSHFPELQDWTLKQLPRLLAVLASETIDCNTNKVLQLEHSDAWCYCGKDTP